MTIAALHRRIGWSESRKAGAVHVGLVLLALVLASAVIGLGMAKPSGAAVGERVMRIAKAAAGGFSDDALHAATVDMDPAMLALARRYDPAFIQPERPFIFDPAADPFGQRLNGVTLEQAAQFNAALPFSTAPNPAARPFSLASANPLDRERAIGCLTEAIYYEAAFEPLDGQRAVAQVIINRMRHPAFPKTICGVIYQGSDRATGCQFSYTCDGALARQPAAWAWARARKVAIAALSGAVMNEVGGATHYHTDYVAPYWAPRLYKVRQIGAHIFYRWPGGWGLPPAFNGRYAGLERPGIDVGGDPNRIDLDTLRLAGVEGIAEAADNAPQVVAALTVSAPRPAAAPSPIIEEPDAALELAKPVAVVDVPPPRPKSPPRLAMPN